MMLHQLTQEQEILLPELLLCLGPIELTQLPITICPGAHNYNTQEAEQDKKPDAWCTDRP